MPPEYHEYIRLCDVYRRDIAATTAMIDTLRAQKRLLMNVASRTPGEKARHSLALAIENLDALKSTLQADLHEASEDAARVREEVRGY